MVSRARHASVPRSPAGDGMDGTLRYDRLAAEGRGSLDIRERMSRSGAHAVADHELVAALLGTGSRGKGVRELASELLGSFDLAGGIPEPGQLASLPGMGSARACRVAAALELGRRFYGHRGRRISCPEDAWQLVRHFDDRMQERFLCCCLNGANDVMAVRVVTVGLANRTIVHPREVFARAVAERSCAVVVAHNHPSGRLEPSPEDLDITERLRQAGELMGIPLLDHLVFSQDSFMSLAEAGMLKP